MSAIVIRSLPEGVHAALKAAAAERGVSMESHVRTILAGQVTQPPASGFADAQASYGMPAPAQKAAALADLHGAMRGSVLTAAGTDLAAPAGEAWDAES